MEYPQKFVIQPTVPKGEVKKNPNAPDYRILRAGDWQEIGACWRKTDKKGQIYLSCTAKESKPDFSKEAKTAEEEFNAITPESEI